MFMCMHAYEWVQVHTRIGICGGQRLALGVFFFSFAHSCCWYLVGMLIDL